MERVTDLIFLGSKITADGDSGHEIKRHLLLGPEYDPPDSARRGQQQSFTFGSPRTLRSAALPLSDRNRHPFLVTTSTMTTAAFCEVCKSFQ